MHHLTLLLSLFSLAVVAETETTETPQPCGHHSNAACPSNLTCIPLSANCTQYYSPSTNHPGCPGTCQPLSLSHQQIYTACGNMIYLDACLEYREKCIADPRRGRGSGSPSGDGPGICWPFRDICGWDTGYTCQRGLACFGGGDENDEIKDQKRFCVDVLKAGERTRVCGGVCLPLRYGSDTYDKTRLEEVWRSDQSGWQGKRPPVWEEAVP